MSIPDNGTLCSCLIMLTTAGAADHQAGDATSAPLWFCGPPLRAQAWITGRSAGFFIAVWGEALLCHRSPAGGVIMCSWKPTGGTQPGDS